MFVLCAAVSSGCRHSLYVDEKYIYGSNFKV